MEKKIPSFDIEIREITVGGVKKNFVRIIPSKINTPWHRTSFDKNKDGLLIKEIADDMQRITSNLLKKNENGKLIGKYNFFIVNLTPNPKSSQGKWKSAYKKFLIDKLKKSKEDLEKFKGKKVFVYVCVYLRKQKMQRNDVDNFLKAILDSLIPYIGDDVNNVSVHIDKKELEGYSKEDLDFIEQIFIVVTDPAAKKDIFR